MVSTGHNDPPWNRHVDICGGGGIDGDTDWSKYDAACILATSKVVRTDVTGILKEIRSLRHGKPTLLRVTNMYNDWIGDPHDGGNTAIQRAVKPVIAAYNTVICQVARQYHAICIDLYHAFNGPDGTRDAGNLLGPDHTHPSTQGHRLIARLLIEEGFRPLHS